MTARIFPDGFLWGVATSAYQIEGATRERGRGESVWDRFSSVPGNILDGSDGTLACDHFHRWREDLALMSRLGVKSYRFSVGWSRVMPQGQGAVRASGIASPPSLGTSSTARMAPSPATTSTAGARTWP